MDGQTGANLVAGRAPAATDEALLDPGTLARSGLAIGDTLEVATTLDGKTSRRLL